MNCKTNTGRLSGLAMRLFLLRISGRDWHKFDGYQKRTSAFWQVWQDARHTIRQGPWDYKRRGKSNREGSNNRRFRAWKSSRQLTPCVVWPDMTIEMD